MLKEWIYVTFHNQATFLYFLSKKLILTVLTPVFIIALKYKIRISLTIKRLLYKRQNGVIFLIENTSQKLTNKS